MIYIFKTKSMIYQNFWKNRRIFFCWGLIIFKNKNLKKLSFEFWRRVHWNYYILEGIEAKWSVWNHIFHKKNIDIGPAYLFHLFLATLLLKHLLLWLEYFIVLLIFHLHLIFNFKIILSKKIKIIYNFLKKMFVTFLYLWE